VDDAKPGIPPVLNGAIPKWVDRIARFPLAGVLAGLLIALTAVMPALLPVAAALLYLAGRRDGLRGGALAVAIAAVVAALLSPIGWVLALLLGLPSLWIALQHWQGHTVMSGLPWLAGGLTVMLALWGFAVGDPAAFIHEALAPTFAAAEAAFRKAISEPAALAQALRTLAEWRDLFDTPILPGILAISWASIIGVGVLLALMVMRALDFARFAQYRMSPNLVWWIVVLGFAAWLGSGPMGFAGINGLMLWSLLYFLAGLALVQWFFERRQTPVGMRALFYIAAAIFFPLALFIALLGLFDTWFHLRERASSSAQ